MIDTTEGKSLEQFSLSDDSDESCKTYHETICTNSSDSNFEEQKWKRDF